MMKIRMAQTSHLALPEAKTNGPTLLKFKKKKK